jgi:glutaredoxin 3
MLKTSASLCDLCQSSRFQVICSVAAVGYLIGSLVGGFLGLWVGVVAGFFLSIFTFGLSIPLGGVIGAFIGGVFGALCGASCGACIGLVCHAYRHDIRDLTNRSLLVILTAVNLGIGIIKPFLGLQARWQAGDYDSDKVRSQIKHEIQSNSVVMYSYRLSPFCMQAERLLRAQGANVKVIDLGIEFLPGLLPRSGAAVRAELGAMTGQTSMPHIFVGGKSIGGLIDGSPGLLPLIEKGELREILKTSGKES